MKTVVQSKLLCKRSHRAGSSTRLGTRLNPRGLLPLARR
ncbi:hypothetical protein R75461_07401 [Paraburkholderia nemoris]|nr:hypothetical protein R75461_07401 [Paraburkholderia nemoris]